jgi:hypothetical protein
VISDARAHPPVEDEHTSAADGRPEDSTAKDAEPSEPDHVIESEEPAAAKRVRRKKAARAAEPADEVVVPRRRAAVPLVPVLAVLLVLLLGAAGFLWFTRSESSAVTTGDYVQVLQEARADIVDFTSFDYLTLDDDIRQIGRVAVGDLAEEAADQLDSRRQEITDAEAVVSTEVIGAGVTRADDEDATVLMVIQTTRQTNASEQAQVVKYRIEVEMQKLDGRWVLAKITGA